MTRFGNAMGKSSSSILQVGKFIYSHLYLISLLFFLLPTIISSIQVAVETNNPSYPAFELAESILVADIKLDKITDMLRESPKEVIGAEKPSEGIINNVKYWWKFIWNVPFKIIGLFLLIFLPFRIAYKIFNLKDKTSPVNNFKMASITFLVYLTITNSIIFVYNLLNNKITPNIGVGGDRFLAYLTILLKFVPFHGLINFSKYLIGVIVHV